MNNFDVFIADTICTRFLGYMFRKAPHHPAILIKPCNSIHTFFMKFDIDVLFLNKDMEVIKRIDGLSRRKIIMPVKGAAAVMEALAGTFQNIKLGEKFEL